MKSEKLSRDKMEALYSKLIATHAHAELKGNTIPYTALNGHMYSFISKQDELALKLPAEEREKFIAKYKTKLAENYGIVQKEFVVVPHNLLAKTSELKPYFAMSYDNVSSLKPKPTAKSKKKA